MVAMRVQLLSPPTPHHPHITKSVNLQTISGILQTFTQLKGDESLTLLVQHLSLLLLIYMLEVNKLLGFGSL